MKVHELLTDKSRWTQHHFAVNAAGRAVPEESRDAVCWCLSGAIRLCYGKDDDAGHWHAVTKRLGMMPSTWNDDPMRTFSEVRALVLELDI